MQIKIENFGCNSEYKIKIFEKKYSIKLPKEYKDFLTKNNGGIVIPNCFDFADKSDSSILDYFLGLDLKEYYYNISYFIDMFSDRIPENLLPIACDPSGNLIVIGLYGNEFGKIFFWDHEFEADNNQPDMSNMHLLATSFNEFLENLYEFDEE